MNNQFYLEKLKNEKEILETQLEIQQQFSRWNGAVTSKNVSENESSTEPHFFTQAMGYLHIGKDLYDCWNVAERIYHQLFTTTKQTTST